jgi:transcriptional regulator with PAS, ATPase and Fis domain
VNCAAIPEGLLESELFGHTRGAFTGTAEPKTGLFEEANAGTVLLDEIGDRPVDLQAKLRRVLEEREVRSVGALETRPIDVRILAATHRNLEGDVEEGRFRRDLFYSLDLVPLHFSPLRVHTGDIPERAQHVLHELSPERSLKPSSSARECLAAMPWQGKVRELENVLEHAAVLCEGEEISEGDLDPFEAEWAVTSTDVDPTMRSLAERRLKRVEMESAFIAETLGLTRGSVARAAEILGVSRRTIHRRLAAGEDDAEFDEG